MCCADETRIELIKKHVIETRTGRKHATQIKVSTKMHVRRVQHTTSVGLVGRVFGLICGLPEIELRHG